MNDRLEGLGPGPARESRVEKLEEAVRELRATKTPGTWTEAERKLFRLLPEATTEETT